MTSNSPAVVCAEDGHLEGKLGSCVRCGRPVTVSSVPRNLEYEREFLHEAARKAELRYGIPTAGFPLAVTRRLEVGEERYKGKFLRQPAAERAQEILEEAQDAAAYAVLDAQVRFDGDLDDSAAWHLFELACHAAAIDAHARHLKSALQ